jgi:hypothetical protein
MKRVALSIGAATILFVAGLALSTSRDTPDESEPVFSTRVQLTLESVLKP